MRRPLNISYGPKHGELPYKGIASGVNTEEAIVADLVDIFHNLCRLVMRHCPNAYACAYAARGLELVDEDEIRAQVPYILLNMTHWQGDRARDIKLALRAI